MEISKANVALEELITIVLEQDKVLMEMMNDPRIPSYVKQTYADMYNDLHIKITDEQLHRIF